MKMQKIAALGLALTLASGGMAFGQNRDDRFPGQGSPPPGNPNGPRDTPRGQIQPQRDTRNFDNRRDDRRDDRRDNRRDDRQDDRRADRQDYRQDYRQNNRWDNRGGNYPGRYGSPPPSYRGARGAGPDHAFYPGNRLPPYWRTRQYVVEDWRGHRLSAPPRGYHWVQSGGDYLLVAVTTGIILQLLLGN